MTDIIHTKTPSDAGFTLVEVLVSMFIFSLISVGALYALTTTLDARERAEARIESLERLAAVRRILADDFDAMVWRQNRDGLGGFVDASRQIGATDGFELTRRARPNPDGVFARGDLQRVGWRVENGTLIRSFLPHENPAFIEPPIDRIVLDGVEAMDVEPVVESIQSIAQLLDQVGNAQRTGPFAGRAVRITLRHSDGSETRHLFELPRG